VRRSTVGFLPWKTTLGDRLFIAQIVLVVLILFWLRFVEPNFYIRGILLVLLLMPICAIIVKYG